MISQKTAGMIWNCYREIEAGKKLLSDLQESHDEFREEVRYGTLQDAFGRQRNLQLGVPSGEHCHTLLQVSPALGECMIRAHIAGKRKELVEANEQARVEIDLQEQLPAEDGP
jgi:hypothetical protein